MVETSTPPRSDGRNINTQGGPVKKCRSFKRHWKKMRNRPTGNSPSNFSSSCTLRGIAGRSDGCFRQKAAARMVRIQQIPIHLLARGNGKEEGYEAVSLFNQRSRGHGHDRVRRSCPRAAARRARLRPGTGLHPLLLWPVSVPLLGTQGLLLPAV